MSEDSRLERVEEAVRESEERFRATFEQAAVGMALVGLDGRWLRVNRKLCDIVGYGHDEMMGLTFQDITHPDDLETDLAYARQLLAGEIPTYSMEKRYIRKDGSPVWINLTVSLARTPEGQPDYFISVVEDISQRKQAEELFRTLADSIPQLCWMADPDGYIVWYNRRWVDYTGKTLEQMWRRRWVPVLEADVQPKVLERWEACVAAAQPARYGDLDQGQGWRVPPVPHAGRAGQGRRGAGGPLVRDEHGHQRVEAGRGGAEGGRPPQGRVPGHARPRAAQPPGGHPQRGRPAQGRAARPTPSWSGPATSSTASPGSSPGWSTTCSTSRGSPRARSS